jgi:hypothetical protein
MIICLQYVGIPSIYNLELNIAAKKKNDNELYSCIVKFLTHVLYNDTCFILFYFFFFCDFWTKGQDVIYFTFTLVSSS